MKDIKIWDKIYGLCLKYYEVHILTATKVTKTYIHYWDKYNEKIKINPYIWCDHEAERDWFICFCNKDSFNRYINTVTKRIEMQRFDLETKQLRLKKLIY